MTLDEPACTGQALPHSLRLSSLLFRPPSITISEDGGGGRKERGEAAGAKGEKLLPPIALKRLGSSLRDLPLSPSPSLCLLYCGEHMTRHVQAGGWGLIVSGFNGKRRGKGKRSVGEGRRGEDGERRARLGGKIGKPTASEEEPGFLARSIPPAALLPPRLRSCPGAEGGGTAWLPLSLAAALPHCHDWLRRQRQPPALPGAERLPPFPPPAFAAQGGGELGGCRSALPSLGGGSSPFAGPGGEAGRRQGPCRVKAGAAAADRSKGPGQLWRGRALRLAQKGLVPGQARGPHGFCCWLADCPPAQRGLCQDGALQLWRANLGTGSDTRVLAWSTLRKATLPQGLSVRRGRVRGGQQRYTSGGA